MEQWNELFASDIKLCHIKQQELFFVMDYTKEFHNFLKNMFSAFLFHHCFQKEIDHDSLGGTEVVRHDTIKSFDGIVPYEFKTRLPNL